MARWGNFRQGHTPYYPHPPPTHTRTHTPPPPNTHPFLIGRCARRRDNTCSTDSSPLTGRAAGDIGSIHPVSARSFPSETLQLTQTLRVSEKLDCPRCIGKKMLARFAVALLVFSVIALAEGTDATDAHESHPEKTTNPNQKGRLSLHNTGKTRWDADSWTAVQVITLKSVTGMIFRILSFCTKVKGACIPDSCKWATVPWRARSEQNRLIDRKMATLRFLISRKDYHVVNTRSYGNPIAS